MYGYNYPDPTQIDGTTLVLTNIQPTSSFEQDDTFEASFTKQERTQYRAFLGERTKSKRKTCTVGKKVKARSKARS